MKDLRWQLLFFSISSLMAGPLKIAHRGASGYEKENTLAAFEKAIELGADMIEFDVHVSKDGKVMIIHDHKVNRTTDGDGFVAEKTAEELQQLSIPTLEQALDHINRRVKVYIDLKAKDIEKEVAKVIKTYVLEKGWIYDDFIVCSFDHYQIRNFKALLPQVKIGALIYCMPIGYGKIAQEIPADIIILDHQLINKEFIDDAHNRGLDVYVYTLNETYEIERIKNLEIDGIISNFPDKI